VRCVPEKTWNLIIDFFPDAIEIKMLRSNDLAWPLCASCKKKLHESETLIEWGENVRSSLSQDILKGRRKHDTFLSEFKVLGSQQFFVVHKNDIENLWKCAKLVAPPIRDIFHLKNDLLATLLRKNCHENYSVDLTHKPYIYEIFSSFLCSEHKCVLNPTIFSLSCDESLGSKWNLKNDVSLLSSAEYTNYIQALCIIVQLLNDMFSALHETDGISDFALDSYLSSFHPRLHFITEKGDVMECPPLKLSIGNCMLCIRMTPSLCANLDCNRKYIESQPLGYHNHRSKFKNKNLNCCSKTVHRVSTETLDDEVTIVHQPSQKDGELLTFRLLQVEETLSHQKMIEVLTEVESEESRTRRSSRKRKLRTPSAGIIAQECLMLCTDHNMAAVRLHILEKIDNFEPKLPLRLFLPQNSNCIEIPYEWNEKSIKEIVQEAVKVDLTSIEHFDIFHNITLIYQVPTKATNYSHIDGEAEGEALLESLLQIANLSSYVEIEQESSFKKNKSSRDVEKGFKGTFLFPQGATTEL
jgi:hypothetical protein